MISLKCDRCKTEVYKLYEVGLHSTLIEIGSNPDGEVYPNYVQLCEDCLTNRDTRFKEWASKMEDSSE